MKMKKNWKRFFTLDRHHAEGFTLVELIVVIAILAILGGVAVPAYSGYIKKANMQADMSLVSEVLQAFELARYAGDQSRFENTVGTIGYVILTDSETDKTVAKGVDEATAAFVQDAMMATFGANYMDMLLSYGDWSDAELMNAMGAVDDKYLTAINKSTYINSIGTENLLGDVQNCATAFSGFLTQFSAGNNEAAVSTLNKYLGDNKAESEFMGYIDKFTGGDYSKATSDVLANATVFGIADQVVGNESNVINSFNNMLDPVTGKYAKLDTGTVTSNEGLYTVATWYAATEAYVAAIDDPDVTAEFKKIDMASNDAGTILANMNGFSDYLSGKLDSTSATYDPDVFNAMGQYYMSGGPAKDAHAYVGIMSTVSGLSDEYKSDSGMMNDGSLFTSGSITNRVNSMVSVVSLDDVTASDPLAAAVLNGTYAGSAILVAVQRDLNGNITCIVTPGTASPVTK